MSQLTELSWLDPNAAVFFLAIFFLIYFIVGHSYNRRLLASTQRSFNQGIYSFDPRHRVTVLGSRIISFSGDRLSDSISEYSLTVVLLSRENPITWIVARIAGRVDMAVLRAKVSGKVEFDFDIVPRGGPAFRQAKALSSVQTIEHRDGIIVLRMEKNPRVEAASRTVLERLARTPGFWRLSVRREVPNIMLNFSPKVAESGGLRNLLNSLSISISSLTG